MITQSNSESSGSNENWTGVDDKFLNSQRSGGGLVSVLLYPAIAVSALVFALYELSVLIK